MNKIKRGDQVIVIAGSSKGARGEVQRVFLNPANGKVEQVLVEGVNMATHFERPNPQKGEQGGIIKREAKIHVSNIAICDVDSGKPMRVKFASSDGKKSREFVMSKRNAAAAGVAASAAKKDEKPAKAAKSTTKAAGAAKPAKAKDAESAESAAKAENTAAKPAANTEKSTPKADKPAAKSAKPKAAKGESK